MEFASTRPPIKESLASGAAVRVPIDFPKIGAIRKVQLLEMQQAGREIGECYRVLTKANLNIVSEVLKGQGTFTEFDHYPDSDVFDSESHSQYFYHAHRGTPDEHGHFHTFLRAAAIPAGMTPAPNLGPEKWPVGTQALSHLIAISMDAYGWPIALFATNRWVTGECWYHAADVVRMLDLFSIDHAFPSWPVNRWITAMIRLFRPQIEALIYYRDQTIQSWSKQRPRANAYEDRELEVTGYLTISVEAQIAQIESLLSGAV